MSKKEGMNNIIAAIEAAKNGYCYFPFSLNRFVGSLTSDQQKLDSLSKQEISVMRYILDGKDNNDIAEKMFMSNKTVSTYKSRLMEKLECKSLINLQFQQNVTKSANHMKFLPYFFLLCCGLWSTISFRRRLHQYRGISSNNRVTLDPVRLSNKNTLVSEQKKSCDCSTQVPNGYLVSTDSQQQVRGIDDYLNLFKKSVK